MNRPDLLRAVIERHVRAAAPNVRRVRLELHEQPVHVAGRHVPEGQEEVAVTARLTDGARLDRVQLGAFVPARRELQHRAPELPVRGESEARLADPTRRHLLDRLFERDGRTLTELESELAMTRFGVMKHLRVLEDAGLVVTRRQGREKLHYLNPVPIRLVHDRWIDKYTEHRVAALADLKTQLEETA